MKRIEKAFHMISTKDVSFGGLCKSEHVKCAESRHSLYWSVYITPLTSLISSELGALSLVTATANWFTSQCVT